MRRTLALIAAATLAVVGGTAVSSSAASRSTQVAVVRCPTTYGISGEQRQTPPSVAVLGRPASTHGLVAYTNTFDYLIGPAGMQCAGVVAVDGGTLIVVWPRRPQASRARTRSRSHARAGPSVRRLQGGRCMPVLLAVCRPGATLLPEWRNSARRGRLRPYQEHDAVRGSPWRRWRWLAERRQRPGQRRGRRQRGRTVACLQVHLHPPVRTAQHLHRSAQRRDRPLRIDRRPPGLGESRREATRLCRSDTTRRIGEPRRGLEPGQPTSAITKREDGMSPSELRVSARERMPVTAAYKAHEEVPASAKVPRNDPVAA